MFLDSFDKLRQFSFLFVITFVNVNYVSKTLLEQLRLLPAPQGMFACLPNTQDFTQSFVDGSFQERLQNNNRGLRSRNKRSLSEDLVSDPISSYFSRRYVL